jgi:tetratricopeptide (TPR) repeat protein
MARPRVAFERAGPQARARQVFETAPADRSNRWRAGRASPAARRRRRGAVADLSRAAGGAEVATGWVNLAAAYLQLGRDREAEGRPARSCGGRARRKAHQPCARPATAGDLRGAADLQEQAAELAPDDADVLANLGTLEAQAGRRPQALRAYLRLLELRPNDGTCHNDVAVLYFREGQIDAARRHVSRALALGAPVSRDFLAALARATGGEPTASAR